MLAFDAVVVGSGPAGAACALRLAARGYAVALVDERTFPRPKLCGEYLNGGAVRELEDLGFGDLLTASSAPLRGMRLFAHGEVADFAFSKRSCSLPRELLDERVRDRALAAGARPIAGRVRGIVAIEDATVVQIAEKSGEPLDVSARYVIGADGMRSTVARLCGLEGPPGRGSRFAIGGHYGGLQLSDWVEMYADGDGYVAINPLDDCSANAVFVLGRDRVMAARENLDEELAAFARSATSGTRNVMAGALLSPRRSIGPIAQRTSRIAGKNVLLAGDAAAFVDPFTGQGVYLALAGARRAADAVATALTTPRRSAWALQRYAAQTRSAIAERRRLALMVKLMVTFGFASRRAARTLQRRPADFAPLIEAVCGNRLAPAEPALALQIARALR